MRMNILAIQLKRIGDVIVTTPALSLLSAKFPAARIFLAVDSVPALLGPAFRNIERVHTFARNSKNLRELLRIGSVDFEYCLDFTGTDRSALVTAMSRAKKRVTFSRFAQQQPRKLLYNVKVDSDVRQRHTIDHYCDLVTGAFDLPEPPPNQQRSQPDFSHLPHGLLAPPLSAVKQVRELLEERDLRAGQYFIIHPGAARSEKMWNRDRWVEVIDYLIGTSGCGCIITGSKARSELRHVAAIMDLLPDHLPVHNLAGSTDLPALLELVRNARFVVGVDTSIIHIAGAFEVPHLALYGDTNPYHWRVRNPYSTVLLAGYPAPLEEFEPRHKKRPVIEISTLDVMTALQNVMAQASVLQEERVRGGP